MEWWDAQHYRQGTDGRRLPCAIKAQLQFRLDEKIPKRDHAEEISDVTQILCWGMSSFYLVSMKSPK